MSRWINPPSRSCRRDMILLPLRLRVIVTGNDRAKESILAAGADQYLDYRKEHYWEVLSGVDYVIDTLGAGEFQRELSVLKPGGRLLSLRTEPNKRFAAAHHFGLAKRALFTAAGAKYDRAAKKTEQGIPFYLCALRWRTASENHQNCGTASHCSQNRSPGLYPGDGAGRPCAGAKRWDRRKGTHFVGRKKIRTANRKAAEIHETL